jgi:DNA polymerase-1
MDLQLNPATREKWITYSARDAIATWWLYNELLQKLKKMPWIINNKQLGDMSQFYGRYLAPFGELLTELEKIGIKLDTDGHLKTAEKKAMEDKDAMLQMFLDWASSMCPDAKYINPASNLHIQQLLFGHYENGVKVSDERVFQIEKDEKEYAEELERAIAKNPYSIMGVGELKALLKERGLKVSGKKADLISRLLQNDASATAFENMR